VDRGGNITEECILLTTRNEKEDLHVKGEVKKKSKAMPVTSLGGL
jgi:hypothetical protein